MIAASLPENLLHISLMSRTCQNESQLRRFHQHAVCLKDSILLFSVFTNLDHLPLLVQLGIVQVALYDSVILDWPTSLKTNRLVTELRIVFNPLEHHKKAGTHECDCHVDLKLPPLPHLQCSPCKYNSNRGPNQNESVD